MNEVSGIVTSWPGLALLVGEDAPGVLIFSVLTFLLFQALSAHEKSLKSAKDLHKLRSFPMRKYAVKA